MAKAKTDKAVDIVPEAVQAPVSDETVEVKEVVEPTQCGQDLCLTCGGTGRHLPEQTCPDCDGTGKVK